jgi:hypothetical protein
MEHELTNETPIDAGENKEFKTDVGHEFASKIPDINEISSARHNLAEECKEICKIGIFYKLFSYEKDT